MSLTGIPREGRSMKKHVNAHVVTGSFLSTVCTQRVFFMFLATPDHCSYRLLRDRPDPHMLPRKMTIKRRRVLFRVVGIGSTPIAQGCIW